MKPVALLFTETAVLWELSGGKPDRREPFIGLPDKRTRVIQQSQKGPLCAYYSMLPLRVRIGPTHSSSFQTFRSDEKIISIWRKELIAISSRRYRLLINSEEYEACINTCHENLLLAFGINYIYMALGDISIKGIPSWKIWHSSGPLTKENLLRIVKNYFNSLPLRDRQALIHNFVIRVLIEKYQLEYSSWTPEQPIDSLMKNLKEHGPMTVSGYLGPVFYLAPPRLSARKISDHSLHYFPKGTQRKPEFGDCHAIIVIGAEKIGDQELVYYSDPHDISDPISGRKIYAQSYNTFVSAIHQPLAIKACLLDGDSLRYFSDVYGVHAHRSLQPNSDR